MSRTLTSTRTITRTITRIGALKSTFRAILNEAPCGLSIERLTNLVETALDERLISQVDLWAKDGSGATHGNYSLVIDYDALDRALKSEPNFSWDQWLLKDFLQSEGMPGEYRQQLSAFKDEATRAGYELSWTVQIRLGVDVEAARKKLGLVPAPEIRWAAGTAKENVVTSQLLWETKLTVKMLRTGK